jgi:CheY-like chemotaxis protein
MSCSTVLYVEDEEFDVLFMRKAFKRAGLETNLKVVMDGREAIDYLEGNGDYCNRQEHPLPSLLLLDLMLPGLSGFDVLKWVRERPGLQSLPVVVFSSSCCAKDKARAEQLGANEFVQKPSSAFDFPSVAQQLRERWLRPCQSDRGRD